MNEQFFLNYFSDIIYVDENPCVITSVEKYKESGELKSKAIRTQHTLITSTLDDFFDSIIDNFTINKKEIDFYPKNIFQKLFNKKQKNLSAELKKFTENNYLIHNLNFDIPNSQLMCKKKDTILVGNKSSVLILKRNTSDCNIEFTINSEDFLILELK
jgi:hypothetical protein